MPNIVAINVVIAPPDKTEAMQIAKIVKCS